MSTSVIAPPEASRNQNRTAGPKAAKKSSRQTHSLLTLSYPRPSFKLVAERARAFGSKTSTAISSSIATPEWPSVRPAIVIRKSCTRFRNRRHN